MYNTNGGPPESHYNLLFMKFHICKVFRFLAIIKPLCWTFLIDIKGSIHIKIHYLIKKFKLCRHCMKHTSKHQIFWFFLSSCGTHLLSFFKWSNNVERLWNSFFFLENNEQQLMALSNGKLKQFTFILYYFLNFNNFILQKVNFKFVDFKSMLFKSF